MPWLAQTPPEQLPLPFILSADAAVVMATELKNTNARTKIFMPIPPTALTSSARDIMAANGLPLTADLGHSTQAHGSGGRYRERTRTKRELRTSEDGRGLRPSPPRATFYAFFWAPMRTKLVGQGLGKNRSFPATAGGHRREAAAMTDRVDKSSQDQDLRNLARVVSACTLGLWAFAAGLLIGVFLFS